MKKICPKCKRNRHVRKYKKNKSMPDGLQYYCVDCQKEMRKKYDKSLRCKILTRRRARKYRANNKEKVKERNRLYYLKNKEIIKCKRNTECILIVEDITRKKKINRNRDKSKFPNIVIDPKPIGEK